MKSCFRFGFFAATLLAQSAFTVMGSALPQGYTMVDWIKGDGTSAYYTTDYVPNPETDCIVIEFKFDSPIDTNHHALFAARRQVNGADDAAYMVTLVRSGSNLLRFSYDRAYWNILTDAVGYLAGKRCAIAVSKNKVAVTDLKDQRAAAVTRSRLTAAGGPLWIFASYTDPDNPTAANFSNMALYSFRVYRNGKLVHNLQPVLDANNEPALFDTCENPCHLERFGTFTAAEGVCRRAVVTKTGAVAENDARQSLASSLVDVDTGTSVTPPADDFDIAYLTDSGHLFGTLVMNAKDTSAYAGQTIVSFGDLLRLRVTPDAAGGGNGSAWSDDGVNAPMTLAEAWDAAAVSGGEVWLKNGTYALANTLAQKQLGTEVTVRGGFDGMETQPDDRSAQDVSTIDGEGRCSGLAFGNSYSVEFDQVRFTRMKSFAVRKLSGSGALTFRKCKISSNLFGNVGFNHSGTAQTASSWNINNFGGVVQGYGADSAMFTAEDCVFDGNALDGATFNVSGGAVGLVRFAQATFDNCLFVSNSVPSGEGTGLCVGTYSTPVCMNGCAFRGNYAVTKRASVVVCWQLHPVEMDHCLFVGNYCPGVDSAGSGIFRRWSSTLSDDNSSTFQNCTFAYNILAQSGVLSMATNQKTITVDDSIFFGNVKVSADKGAGYTTGTDISYESGAITVRRTLFGGEGTAYVDKWGTGATGSATLTDCVFGDPTFVTATAEFKQLFGVDEIPLDPTTTFPGFEEAVKLDCHAASFKSLSVNKGDPTSDCSKEPKKNGAPIDLGFYGNTSELPVPATGLVIFLK